MDEEKISVLKDTYRIAETSELLRLLLTNAYEHIRRQNQVLASTRTSQ
jgi:hypothetical protein